MGRESYRHEVLPPSVRVRLGIEAASGDRLFQEFKFTPQRAAEMVRGLLARRSA